MKILKLSNTLFIFHFVFNGFCLKAKEIPSYNYRDTTLSFDKFNVEFKETYVKKNLWLRTTLVIFNKSDQYLLINPKEILFSTERQTESHSLYNKTIVIPPNYSKTFYLKFSGNDYNSKFVSFNFTKIHFTKDPENIPISQIIKAEKGFKFKNDRFSFRVAGTEILPKEFIVDIKLKYNVDNMIADKFLAINFNSIGIYSKGTDTCYNLKKGVEKFHYDPGVNRETYRLLFSRNCLDVNTNKKYLLFDQVFTEYTLTTFIGFKISLNAVERNESFKKAEKKKDIELIE